MKFFTKKRQTAYTGMLLMQLPKKIQHFFIYPEYANQPGTNEIYYIKYYSPTSKYVCWYFYLGKVFCTFLHFRRI